MSLLIGVPKIFRYQINVSFLHLWSKFLWCLGAFIVLKNFSFILTEKRLLLHMGVHKPFISFLLCTWKWSNNGVFCCNYLPFAFVNCNFCLFWNENQLVWSLEKHLRLWTGSNEQIVFWCKWKARLREVSLFYAEGCSLSTGFVLIFWQNWTALLKSINKPQPMNNRNGTPTCQI